MTKSLVPIDADDYAAKITDVIAQLFDEDSDNHVYNIDSIDGTAFFTGFIIAFGAMFNRLCDGSEDLLGTTHVANRLAVQYLRKNGIDDLTDATDAPDVGDDDEF